MPGQLQVSVTDGVGWAMYLGSCKFPRTLLVALGAFVLSGAIAFSNTTPENKTQKEMDHVRKLAEKGNVEQEIQLAAAYMTGHGVSQDLTKSAHWYQKAAESGDPDAENQIGYFCQHGMGVPVDAIRSFHWYQLASASGSIQAKVNMGVSYLYGTGIPRNPATARQLFLEAAREGSGLAAAYLGDAYLLGLGGPRDPEKGETWLALGVRLHDPVAAYSLGFLLSIAPDHHHDLPRAVELLRISAAKGYVPAIHQLALLLINHPELDSAQQEAASLLQESSGAGAWKSSVVLGILARDGRLISTDPALASYYFHLAVLQGGAPAQHLLAPELAKLAQRIPTQVDSARAAQASQWFEQHQVPMLYVINEKKDQKNFPVAAVADFGITLQTGQ